MDAFKVGDSIMFCDESEALKAASIDITIGKVYEIAGVDMGEMYFIDDAGEENYSILATRRGRALCTPTKVPF